MYRSMVLQSWLILTYKVPPEPAAKRIALWRRLKGMGAVYLQNGVCLLPKTDDHVRRLKMLENDIAEISAAFFASLVEVVEAFTIVLAVATLRGWRSAALGTAAALVLLGTVVLTLGPLLDRVPIHLLQLVIGILLLLFGMGWLRKAAL